MTLQRCRDWPERLAAFIDARRAAPFKWGENDCVLFAADAVRAIAGIDLAEGHRGLSEFGALRLWRRTGGVLPLVEARLSRRDAPGFAQRGDVVSVPIDGSDTLGIVVGNGHWCAPGAGGLVFRPMTEVSVVFAV
jgi:cell wall-associated NlpC family hydrolase